MFWYSKNIAKYWSNRIFAFRDEKISFKKNPLLHDIFLFEMNKSNRD